jgi:hypothetical protein
MSALLFAFAQMAVSRFEPAERGSSFFVADDLAFRSPAAGATRRLPGDAIQFRGEVQ